MKFVLEDCRDGIHEALRSTKNSASRPDVLRMRTNVERVSSVSFCK